MEMTVNLNEHSYPILIKKGLLNTIESSIQSIFQGQKIMIISDDNVFPIYGPKIIEQLSNTYLVQSVVVPAGEASKSFDTLPKLYQALLDFKLTRTDLIIALGGGVIGDLTGFVASSYLRGVPFVQIPTSLLAQVDSSVGGKVAVDLPQGKNLVGAFYHPKLVIIDPETLQTLSPHFISDGMGEVIKYGCINDAKFFTQLQQYQDFDDLYKEIEAVIYRCVDAKRKVVEADQFDFGDRLFLNFGHTLAHAIEQYYHYETYSHGAAVAIGMVQISKISELAGMTKPGTSKQIEEVVKKYHLPTQCGLPTSILIDAIALDKKNINKKLSYILLKEIGSSFIYPSDHSLIQSVETI